MQNTTKGKYQQNLEKQIIFPFSELMNITIIPQKKKKNIAFPFCNRFSVNHEAQKTKKKLCHKCDT